MTSVDDLLTYIFAGKHAAFRTEFAAWVRGSRRFKAFVTDHRSKIHTKLRSAVDDLSLQDVRAELETALLLLGEERFALAYETYAPSKGRGPDFTVTFKTHTPFNVEVRRLRSVEVGDDSEALLIKLMGVLCDKVGQMPTGMMNLLWLKAERTLSTGDVARAMVTLRQRADRKEEEHFTRRGFADAADYLRHDRQLSAIVVRAGDIIMLWHNPVARHKMPPDIANALQRLK